MILAFNRLVRSLGCVFSDHNTSEHTRNILPPTAMYRRSIGQHLKRILFLVFLLILSCCIRTQTVKRKIPSRGISSSSADLDINSSDVQLSISLQSAPVILMIVCHPDDESIFGASILGTATHVVVVTDADSSNTGQFRRKSLEKAMKLASSSWDMWDLPESIYSGPNAVNGWSTTDQNYLVSRLQETFLKFESLQRIVTHNALGEYGHVDHRKTHAAVLQAFLSVYGGSVVAPSLEVFAPIIDYSNNIDRLRSPPASCVEGELHKKLLSSYAEDGNLGNAELFRNICYKICRINFWNGELLPSGASAIAQTLKEPVSCCGEIMDNSSPVTMSAMNNEGVLTSETNDIEMFWIENPDRAFMSKFYPRLSRFTAVLDIGARRYNRNCKTLIDHPGTRYVQLEPRPPVDLDNDGLLHCVVEDSASLYPQYLRYFDVVIDFGVLGWGPVKAEVEVYILNVISLLKPKGLYVLKLDDSGAGKFNLSDAVDPYFERVTFDEFESDLRLGENGSGSRIYFLRSRE